MSETAGLQPNRKPWSEAVATFLTCLALGPPIGGIVFALSVALSPELSGVPQAEGSSLGGQLYTALFLGLFAIPFSYLIGSIQAAATGLSFAAYGWKRGRPPFWFAAVTAAAVFAGAAMMDITEAPDTFVPMIFVHAVPTVLCWLIVRNYWREKMS